jgi:hypothetical protein
MLFVSRRKFLRTKLGVRKNSTYFSRLIVCSIYSSIRSILHPIDEPVLNEIPQRCSEQSKEVFLQLQKMKAKSKKKGKMLNYMGSKDITEVKRKRKKRYEAYEIDQIDKASERSKRSKIEESRDDMNIDVNVERMRSYSDLQAEADQASLSQYYEASNPANP